MDTMVSTASPHKLPAHFFGDEMINILEEVKSMLTKYPVLRDSDERLLANIWKVYVGDLTWVNGEDILKMLAKGELPSYESISRCRRKLQEEIPALRGEKWEARHKNQKVIKKELKEMEVILHD
jgi:hypothetical protein